MSNPGNVAGGHRANLKNPNTSEESKQHSREVLEGGLAEQAAQGGDDSKNPNNVAGGLKATLHNPNVSEAAKQDAQKRLDEMK